MICYQHTMHIEYKLYYTIIYWILKWGCLHSRSGQVQVKHLVSPAISPMKDFPNLGLALALVNGALGRSRGGNLGNMFWFSAFLLKPGTSWDFYGCLLGNLRRRARQQKILMAVGSPLISLGRTTSSSRRSPYPPTFRPLRMLTRPSHCKASSVTCRILVRLGCAKLCSLPELDLNPNKGICGNASSKSIHPESSWHPIKVKMELSHHEQDSDGNFKSAKPLVFVLDEPPEDGVKKENKKPKKTAPITAKTFGAYVSIPGVKDADNLCLAWRRRPLFFFKLFRACWCLVIPQVSICTAEAFALRIDSSASNSKGGKVIMPIRPVVLLKHQLEVNNETVCLVWGYIHFLTEKLCQWCSNSVVVVNLPRRKGLVSIHWRKQLPGAHSLKVGHSYTECYFWFLRL